MDESEIAWPQGRYNPAGTKRLWYAFQEDVLTFPTLADSETGTTFDSLVTYDTAIVMKTGKQFFPLYHTVETGEIRSTMVGSRDGKGFENFVEISFPGNTTLFLGFLAATANRNIITIMEEKNNVIRVLGDLTDSETGTTFDSLVTYDTAIVMKTGKQFFPLYHTVETGEIRSTMVGSRDGKGFENFVEISFPGNTTLFLGFLAATANRNIIAIMEEKNNVLRVLGDLTD